MTPDEIAAAWQSFVVEGDRAGYDRVLDGVLRGEISVEIIEDALGSGPQDQPAPRLVHAWSDDVTRTVCDLDVYGDVVITRQLVAVTCWRCIAQLR